jgi:hypothetical protein
MKVLNLYILSQYAHIAMKMGHSSKASAILYCWQSNELRNMGKRILRNYSTEYGEMGKCGELNIPETLWFSGVVHRMSKD